MVKTTRNSAPPSPIKVQLSGPDSPLSAAKTPLRFVILGATGFVGAALIRKISDLPPGTVEVRALIRDSKRFIIPSSPFQWVEGDLLEISKISKIRKKLFFNEPHGVIHFATRQTDFNGEGFHKVNVEGTASLLQTLPQSTQWLIYGSSASVYGQCAQQGTGENSPVTPQTELARSRRAAEELILTWMGLSRRSAFVLRPRFILGAGDRFTLPAFLKLFQQGIRIGNGNQRYSVIEVSDYAAIILKLAQYLTTRAVTRIVTPLNIGYSQSVSFNELAAAAAKELGTPNLLRFKIPISNFLLQSFRTLRNLPFQIPRLEKLTTQLELVGLDHYLSMDGLEQIIGKEIPARNPLEIVSQTMKNLKTPSGDQKL